MQSNGTSALDTFPRLLLHQAMRNGKKTAMREKAFGIWQSRDWSRVADEVRGFACGLAARGFQRGENLAIMGDIHARLYWAITAAHCLGGVAVPLPVEASEDELSSILNQTESRFIVVQDQEQVDKLLEMKGSCPRLETIIYANPRGMQHYTDSCLCAYENIRKEGCRFDAESADFFTGQVAQGQGTDTAVIFYAADTAGRSKGVMLSHDSLISAATRSIEELRLRPDEDVLAFLPMTMNASLLFFFAQPYVAGFCVNFPESYETVVTDMREIGPSFYFATPQVYKSLFNLITLRMEDAGALKRRLFRFFMGVAHRTGPALLDGRSVSLAQRFLYRTGQLLMFAPLKNILGLSRIRLALTGGNSASPEILGLYRALGINLKQFYGPPEGCSFIALQRDGQVRPSNVGVAVKEVQIRIAEAGEIAFRGPSVFQGYYRGEEAAPGRAGEWVKTGVMGRLDQQGELSVLGAMADQCRLADGTPVAPSVVECILKSFPFIKEAVAFGHEKPFVTAFITIDGEVVTHWADRHNIVYAGYADLTQQEAVYGLIKSCVEETNARLYDSGQNRLQVRRFLILPREIENGALNHDGDVCRDVIAQRYGDLIKLFYTFEEDRRIPEAHPGIIRSTQTLEFPTGVKIRDVQVVEKRMNLEGPL
ncbi:MAG: AMP-binding protein [Nitrospirales bacterium]|nr:AMP-binding protein [Nitrospirales bacterium]